MNENVKVDLPRYSFLLLLIVRAVRSVSKLFLSVECKGLKNIPEGACFLTPNHQSKLDPFLILAYLDKKILKNTFAYAKKDHAKGFMRKYLANNTNVIIMDLANELKESILKMAEVVKQGKKVLIFPEGTRTTSGEMGSFKKTYALISSELNIPILPIAISGAYYGDPTDRFRIKRTKIIVEFLPAIDPVGLTPDELNELVRQRIEEKIKNQEFLDQRL